MVSNTRLPESVHYVWDWQSRGACRDIDSRVFFHPEFERGPSRDARVAQAKAICRRCPVLERCREHALTVQEAYGTWGGLDELERRYLIGTLRRTGRAV